jgi:hypothetical protein
VELVPSAKKKKKKKDEFVEEYAAPAHALPFMPYLPRLACI